MENIDELARVQSLGEYRVGTNFNPSDKSVVTQIKQKVAEAIDLIDGIVVADGEGARCKSIAMTALEEGAMWGVKAATKPTFADRPGLS